MKTEMAVTGCTYQSPVGPLGLWVCEAGVCRIALGALVTQADSHPLLTRLRRQLTQYFAGQRRDFDVPLAINGSDFLTRVARALRQIPYGTTATYGDLAKQLNTSPRAIGGACRRNPLPIIVPCHRVVAKTGIGGYDGQWQQGDRLDIKHYLLRLEKGSI